MSRLICYIGVIGSGKDYQAKRYISENPNTLHINFADELREMAWDILGWRPNTNEEYEDFKQSNMCQYVEADKGYCLANIARIDFTGREFLQRLGTEALRKRDADFWANCWKRKVNKAIAQGYDVVCSDLRFTNELECALSLKISDNPANHDYVSLTPDFIFCDYKSERYDDTNTHESEKLAQHLLDCDFMNGDRITDEFLKGVIKNLDWSKQKMNDRKNYSIHNGGTLLKCHCGNTFHIPKKFKNFVCTQCDEKYIRMTSGDLKGLILIDGR